MMADKTGFAITGARGFHVTFKNGVTVSVQFGAGNYCEHHVRDISMIGKEKNHSPWESIDAEVAMWDKEGAWLTGQYFEDDQVHGWLAPDELPELLAWAASYKDDSA